MGNIKFGKEARNMPVPGSISRRIDIISALAGALIVVVQAAPFIPAYYAGIVSWLCGATVTVCQVLKPYYGEDMHGATVVPIDDVKETEIKQP